MENCIESVGGIRATILHEMMYQMVHRLGDGAYADAQIGNCKCKINK
jgi:hypothetical protein